MIPYISPISSGREHDRQSKASKAAVDGEVAAVGGDDFRVMIDFGQDHERGAAASMRSYYIMGSWVRSKCPGHGCLTREKCTGLRRFPRTQAHSLEPGGWTPPVGKIAFSRMRLRFGSGSAGMGLKIKLRIVPIDVLVADQGRAAALSMA
jgi:hypothetical protein